MKYLERFGPAVLVLASVVVAVGFVYLATIRTFTSLENILFQTIALSIGLAGSFFFGRQSAKANAREMIEPHARSACRRLLTLYRGLLRVGKTIRGNEGDAVKLKIIKAIVEEQVFIADDALADWQDVVPEAVAELTKASRHSPAEKEGLENG